MIRNRRLLFLILALSPMATSAAVYSWKDPSGKIHYGDRPPAEEQKSARQLAAPPPVDESAQKANVERRLEDREKQQRTQETGKATPEDPAQARIRAENCQQSKARLAAIESGEMRFALDAKGEKVGLDGAARDAELAKARQAVSDWCSPPKPAEK